MVCYLITLLLCVKLSPVRYSSYLVRIYYSLGVTIRTLYTVTVISNGHYIFAHSSPQATKHDARTQGREGKGHGHYCTATICSM